LNIKKEHCCPQGYKCDVKDGRCNRGSISLPFFKKTPATPVALKKLARETAFNLFKHVPAKLMFKHDEPKKLNEPVLCGDKKTTCDPLKTCCKFAVNGEYGW
jgi:hypothetical protein